MARACEMISDVLIEAGVDHVFGIPGGGTIPIWNALYDKQDRINVILARHEQAASCMADIYGRIKGKPAVPHNDLSSSDILATSSDAACSVCIPPHDFHDVASLF